MPGRFTPIIPPTCRPPAASRSPESRARLQPDSLGSKRHHFQHFPEPGVPPPIRLGSDGAAGDGGSQPAGFRFVRGQIRRRHLCALFPVASTNLTDWSLLARPIHPATAGSGSWTSRPRICRDGSIGRPRLDVRIFTDEPLGLED